MNFSSGPDNDIIELQTRHGKFNFAPLKIYWYLVAK